MTHLGLVTYHLSMSVTQTKDSVSLNQKSYVERVLLQSGIDKYKFASLPINL